MGFPIDNTPKSGSIRPPKCGDLHPPQLTGLDWAVLAMIGVSCAYLPHVPEDEAWECLEQNEAMETRSRVRDKQERRRTVLPPEVKGAISGQVRFKLQ